MERKSTLAMHLGLVMSTVLICSQVAQQIARRKYERISMPGRMVVNPLQTACPALSWAMMYQTTYMATLQARRHPTPFAVGCR